MKGKTCGKMLGEFQASRGRAIVLATAQVDAPDSSLQDSAVIRIGRDNARVNAVRYRAFHKPQRVIGLKSVRNYNCHLKRANLFNGTDALPLRTRPRRCNQRAVPFFLRRTNASLICVRNRQSSE